MRGDGIPLVKNMTKSIPSGKPSLPSPLDYSFGVLREIYHAHEM